MVAFDQKLEERFTHALRGGARAWRMAFERQLKTHGLTAAGWSAMAALAEGERAPSQTELAQQLGVDGATLVSTIDRLAAGGLIERVPSSHDRRVKQVVLTAGGRQLAGALQREAAALRQATLARLDPQQVAAAADLLEQLQHVLERA